MKVLICIGGPTASGKTALAIDTALELGAEIISFDSRQIYKELNIGVAKPDEEDLKKVNHYFINHISIHEKFTAADFETQAFALLNDLFEKSDLVVAVGGTGLYINALLNGLDEMPPITPEAEKEIDSKFIENGLSWLQEYITLNDSAYAKVVDMNNHVRLLRAAKLMLSSGKKFSDFRTGIKKPRSFKALKFFIDPERDVLYDRINFRVDMMIDAGQIEEASSLQKFAELRSLQTVGYSELFSYFKGEISIEEAIDKIKQNSRRYAKRQFTWFRNQGDWLPLKGVDKEIDLKIIKQAINDLEV